MVLSNLLQQEGTTLASVAKLHLNNVGIDDDDVEILANSLKHNTSLTNLDLGRNNITEIGYRTVLKLLNDVSSIDNTYNSNHSLTKVNGAYIGKHDTPKMKKIKRHIDSALQMNRQYSDNAYTGKVKVIHTQLNSANRMELAKVQEIDYSYESLFSGVDPIVLPEVLALVERNCTHSVLFRMLVAVVPDLASLVNKEAALKERRKDNGSDKSILWSYLSCLVCGAVLLAWKGKGRR